MTGTANHKKALKAAAVWDADLREGRYQKRQWMTWEAFRDRYDSDVLAGMKESTAISYSATLNVFERTVAPQRLAGCTTSKLTAFVVVLRDQHLSAATIARHLRQLKVAFRWAHRQDLFVKLPGFDRIKQSKGAPVVASSAAKSLTGCSLSCRAS